MTSKRKLLGAAAFSAALAGGGLAGAMLGTPGTSGAQDGTTSTTEATSDSGADAARPHPFRPERGERLETAAAALGITAEELKAELQAGKSIAQVAEEHDVDVQTVIDALVTEGTARLEAMKAALPDRVTEMVNREGLPERGPRGHRGPRPADARADDEAAAEDT